MSLLREDALALAIGIGYDAAGIARPASERLPAWTHSVLVGMHATLDEAFDYEMYLEYEGRRKWYKPIYTALESLSFRLAEMLRARGLLAAALTYEDSIALVDLKAAAVEAGLGVLGRNGLVVSRRYGPRVRFGAVFTDAPWDPTGPLRDYFCPSCTRCWNACPTGALGPGGLDRSRCIAEYAPSPELAGMQERLERRPSAGTRLQCSACMTSCPIGARLPVGFYRLSPTLH
jgi:epoxyqueuosine reductase